MRTSGVGESIAIVVFALMGVAPLFGWRKTSPELFKKSFRWPVAALVVAGVVHIAFGRSWGVPAFITVEPIYPGAMGNALARMASTYPFFTMMIVAFNITVVVQEFGCEAGHVDTVVVHPELTDLGAAEPQTEGAAAAGRKNPELGRVRVPAGFKLGNASAERRFAGDPYIQAAQPKSILCLALMHQGRLHQWDDAYTLYHRPATRFVADFIGHGVFAPATLVQRGNNVVAQTPLGDLTDLAECPLPASFPGGECDVLLRADDVVHDDHAPVQAQILRKSFRGSEFLYTLRLASGHTLMAHVPSHHNHAVGEWIGIRAQVDHVVTFARV